MINEASIITPTNDLVIEVFGTDLGGSQFVEHCQTVLITRDGATIFLANKLAPESEIIVRNPETNQETVARVVGLIREAIFVQLYGIVFVDPSANLWQVELPEVAQTKVVMECGHCHKVDIVSLGEIEMMVLESTHVLTRYCDCSNHSTTWRQTDRRLTKREGSGQPQQISYPIQGPAGPASQERRRDRRTAIKVPACIRFEGEEAVVECEDVSRRGFRFKSRRSYPEGMSIEAATPYAKGSVNIFVSAVIAYQQKLSGEFYRHGVAYTASIKNPGSKF